MSGNTAEPLTLAAFPHAIAHVDADAFFTSVEQALRPELRGKPVITGRERGIVACASYEARALGVRRAVRLSEARKLCPNLICLDSDYETYGLFSVRLFEILRRFTPAVEEYSMDEAFADLAGLRRVHRMSYPHIARAMQAAVRQELGITVSVGLSVTKTLAKLASGWRKPAGFQSIPADELREFLPQVSLDKVCGFGPNTVALLEKQDLKTAWDFARLPPGAEPVRLLGKTGRELRHELRGEWVYPVAPDPGRRASIHKCRTFTPPSSDRDRVKAELLRNLEEAFIKLRRHRLRARAAALLLRDQRFQTHGLEAEFDRATSSTMEGVRLLSPLFDRLFRPGLAYRLTGIVLLKLQPDNGEVQYSLFEDPCAVQSLRGLDRTLDELRGMLGRDAIRLGAGPLPPEGAAPRRLNLPVWRIPV